jgi:hypothetical protein
MHILVLKSVGAGRNLPADTVAAVFLATDGQALGAKT